MVTQDAFIMLVDDRTSIGGVADLYVFPVEKFCSFKNLCSLEWGGKCLSTSFRNSLPILVLTCSL